MNTNAMNTLTAILAPLSTFCTGAFKTLRKANRLRIYRPEVEVQWTPEVNAAVKALLEAGHTVKVYEKTFIYTPTLVADTVIWERRDTVRDRSKPNARFDHAYSCVEVSL